MSRGPSMTRMATQFEIHRGFLTLYLRQPRFDLTVFEFATVGTMRRRVRVQSLRYDIATRIRVHNTTYTQLAHHSRTIDTRCRVLQHPTSIHANDVDCRSIALFLRQTKRTCTCVFFSVRRPPYPHGIHTFYIVNSHGNNFTPSSHNGSML